MKIVTWNVNSIRVRSNLVKQLAEDENPSILCMQEIKSTHETYPKFESVFVSTNGQKSNNGVSIHTYKADHGPVSVNPLKHCSDARIIASTYNNIRFINVYIPSGGGSQEAYFKKILWLRYFIEYLREQRKIYKYIVLLGDFNICPSMRDVWNYKDWTNVCNNLTCTALEREAFREMLDLGFVDSFNTFTKRNDFTWWDYQKNSFAKNHGLRIDHILVTENLMPNVVNAKVLVKYRSLERPSDHAPLMVEIRK